jgi:hypothetical protein
MKDVFGWTLPDLLEFSAPYLAWHEDTRPAAYKHKILNPGPKEIQVNSQGWTEKRQRCTMRYARFQSQQMDIATALLFPTASPEVLPVFVAEWVAIADRIHVIVLDAELISPAPALHALLHKEFIALQKKWQAVFTSNKDKPAWFSEIESPWAMYASAPLSSACQLREMYREYAHTFIKQIWVPLLPEAKSGPDHKAVAQYKDHHQLNSPARTIVKGENAAWLDTFLTDYHFGILTDLYDY